MKTFHVFKEYKNDVATAQRLMYAYNDVFPFDSPPARLLELKQALWIVGWLRVNLPIENDF